MRIFFSFLLVKEVIVEDGFVFVLRHYDLLYFVVTTTGLY